MHRKGPLYLIFFNKIDDDADGDDDNNEGDGDDDDFNDGKATIVYYATIM